MTRAETTGVHGLAAGTVSAVEVDNCSGQRAVGVMARDMYSGRCKCIYLVHSWKSLS